MVLLGILAALFFILLNGFFVAAEFALVKMSTARGMVGRERPDGRDKMVQQIVTRLDRYLSVTQLGITLASLGLGWVGEPAIEKVVLSLFVPLHAHLSEKYVHAISIALAFTVLTFGHVLFGELVPKLIAIQRSRATARGVVWPLRLTFLAFRPLLFILEQATAVVLRTMGMKANAASEGALSEDEIVGILTANAARLPEGKAKSELVERVLRFADRTAKHAMIPRVDVVSLPLETTGQDAQEELRSMQYSRVLLTKGKSLDDVQGYLYAKDLFLNEEAASLPALTSLRRDLLFVPEAQGLMDVLRTMQTDQVHLAVVVDEYGGTSGIVTMEDLLEEIVGEIRDEFDVEPAAIQPVQNQKNTWDVDQKLTVDELDHLGVTFPPELATKSLGEFVIETLGRIPRRGDRVMLGENAILEVTALRRRRIVGLRLRVTHDANAEETA